MDSLITRSGRWLVRRIVPPVLLGVLGLAAFAMWLIVMDPEDFETRRTTTLRRLAAERSDLEGALAGANQRILRTEAEIAAQQERLRLAEGVLAVLREDQTAWRTAWNKLFGESDQERTNEERRVRLEKMKADSTARVARLRETLTRTIWERDGIDIALARIAQNVAAAEKDDSKSRHYGKRAWNEGRGWAVALLAAWLLVPGLWCLRRRLSPRATKGAGI